MQQRPNIPLDRTIPNELMSNQIRIMRRRDEIIRQRQRHIVKHPIVMIGERGIVPREEEGGECGEGPRHVGRRRARRFDFLWGVGDGRW